MNKNLEKKTTVNIVIYMWLLYVQLMQIWSPKCLLKEK